MDTRKLIEVGIVYEEAGKLPLRWALYSDDNAEPFLMANPSFKTQTEAYRDAKLLLLRLGKTLRPAVSHKDVIFIIYEDRDGVRNANSRRGVLP